MKNVIIQIGETTVNDNAENRFREMVAKAAKAILGEEPIAITACQVATAGVIVAQTLVALGEVDAAALLLDELVGHLAGPLDIGASQDERCDSNCQAVIASLVTSSTTLVGLRDDLMQKLESVKGLAHGMKGRSLWSALQIASIRSDYLVRANERSPETLPRFDGDMEELLMAATVDVISEIIGADPDPYEVRQVVKAAASVLRWLVDSGEWLAAFNLAQTLQNQVKHHLDFEGYDDHAALEMAPGLIHLGEQVQEQCTLYSWDVAHSIIQLEKLCEIDAGWYIPDSLNVALIKLGHLIDLNKFSAEVNAHS
jgi:hypothetical protein